MNVWRQAFEFLAKALKVGKVLAIGPQIRYTVGISGIKWEIVVGAPGFPGVPHIWRG
jgi:hypothetical protein